jgi:hypothetical protein
MHQYIQWAAPQQAAGNKPKVINKLPPYRRSILPGDSLFGKFSQAFISLLIFFPYGLKDISNLEKNRIQKLKKSGLFRNVQ